MADANYQDFDRRLARILRRHDALSRGHTVRLTRDGRIVAVPRRRLGLRMPWAGLLALILCAVLAKAGLLAHLGAEDYGARVAALRLGTPVDRAGARVMAPDPATSWLAGRLPVWIAAPRP